jgi:hypothetical protein
VRRNNSIGGNRALDESAREAVLRFLRILSRYGCSHEDIARAVDGAAGQTGVPRGERARRFGENGPAHLLTLWFSDPDYLDEKGRPKALTLTGATPSISTLLKRLKMKLKGPEVVAYLTRHKALKRIGARYIPRDRALVLAQQSQWVDHLHALLGLLRTLDHNAQAGGKSPHFRFYAENPHFPVSAKEAFDRRAGALGRRLLEHLDGDMHRCELARRPGERTMRIGVGVYRFESGPTPAPRRRKPKRRKGG